MSPFQSVDPLAQADADVDQLQQQIPDVCTATDLAGPLRVTEAQVRRLYRERKLDFLLLTPQLGRSVLFSGAKVRAWLRGEDLTAGRRFFGKARGR